MSNLQILARLGTKRWSRLASLLRASTESKYGNPSHRHDRLPSSLSCNFYSSDGKQKINSLRETETERLQTADSGTGAANSASEQTYIKNEEFFDEIMDEVQKPYASKFVKDCEWRLYQWNRQMMELQNAGQPVRLNKIVSDSLPEVVKFVLTPQAPAYMRQKCLVLLLTLDTDSELLTQVLLKTVEDVMHLPINVLVDIIQSLSTSQETALRKQIRMDLVTVVVNRRWYEISPKHAVFFMYQLDELFDMKTISHQLRQIHKEDNKTAASGQKFGQDSTNSKMPNVKKFEGENIHKSSVEEPTKSQTVPVLSVNIETQIINLANELKVKDLARVVTLLGKWRNRNETLLNTTIHRLNQADFSDFSFVQLNNLLFSCSVLSIHNDNFLRKVSDSLAQTLPTSPSLACAVLVSSSHLRWKDSNLISKYLQYLKEHLPQMKSKDAQNVLMSLANLHAVPMDDLEVNLIKDLASIALTKDLSAGAQVNCTWCLAVLKCLSAEIAGQSLQPEFVKQFLDSSNVQSQAYLQKVCSINNAVRYEVQSYSGPYIAKDVFEQIKSNPALSDKALTNSFVNALRKFADLSTYVKLSERLKENIVIDAVMCASSNGDVRPLAVLEQEETKEDIYWLAIQLVPFTGVVNPCQTPTGPYQMAARHLKQLGYIPVQILYSDLKASHSVLEHINSIKRKIKDAVDDRQTDR